MNIRTKTRIIFKVSWNVRVGGSKKFSAPRTLISSLTTNHDEDNDAVKDLCTVCLLVTSTLQKPP